MPTQRYSSQPHVPLFSSSVSWSFPSCWALDTTLDRSKHEGMKFDDYYRIISSFHPEVETLTGNTWSIPAYQDIVALVQDYDRLSLELSFGRNPAYDYLAYLRHHGFPSPLLDWTRSPYIAAYFAFSKAKHSTKRVSIYVLSEADLHTGSSGIPIIYRFRGRVRWIFYSEPLPAARNPLILLR